MGSLNLGQVAVTGSEADNVAPLPPSDVLLCVRTGKIRPLAGVKIKSAINKQPRQGKIRVTETGLIGDEVQYEMHGGTEKALHMYCAAHYETWNRELPNREHLFKVGGFGENLSVRHLSEDNVCVGDIFRAGPDVILQVSDARQPCFKLNHRFEHKKTSFIAQTTGRIGWYYRVLKTGYIQEGDVFELVERTNPTWPLSRLIKHLYHDVNNLDAMNTIVRLPGLGSEMAEVFTNRINKGAEDFNGRLQGDRIPVAWRSYQLKEKVDLTSRIKRFVFEIDGSSADDECAEFGRFPHVRLQFGPDWCYSRAYSVVSGDMKRLELGIAKDDNSRGGSAFMHEKVQVGDVLRIAEGHEVISPKTDCVDNLNSKKHIYIVGGIGVTAFLRDIAKLSQSPAEIEVHYAVRSRKDAAYLGQLPARTTTIYAKDEGNRLDVKSIIPIPEDGNFGAMIYCCGPTSLLEECQRLTRKLGYPRSHSHFEEFGGATTGTGNPFEIEIKSTGKVLQVPQEKSLLQILNEAGFEIESSCLVGNCGTCMVDYCKGDVEHRGTALDDEMKEETMLTCVSRGKGRIVIDC
ncbi:pyruvate kinase-like protein [Pestalotiopsis sp. NC0098]|nr:pyruvate kinase-like protein [Pestalotiopsis sp. NC0098]